MPRKKNSMSFEHNWIRTGEFRYINVGSSSICMLRLDPVADFWELTTGNKFLSSEPIEPNYFLEVLESIGFVEYYDAPAHHGNQANYEKYVKKNP